MTPSRQYISVWIEAYHRILFLAVLQLLLAKKGNVDKEDSTSKRRTAVHTAAVTAKCPGDIFKSVISSSKDIDKRDGFGRTALMLLVCSYTVSVCLFMVVAMCLVAVASSVTR